MKIIILLLSLMTSSLAWASQDLPILKERFLNEIRNSVPRDQLSTWRVSDIEKWLKTIKEDGSFPDYDYSATKNITWGPSHNLGPALAMGLAYKTPGHPYYQNQELKETMLRAIRFITRKEWEHFSWWHIEIGLPLTTYKLLFLLEEELTPQDKDWLLRATRKGHISDHPSNWTANGQNAIWYAEITMALGVLFQKPEWLITAREAVAKELSVGNKQGIQVDQTFYQHGKLFYNGGYGLGFSIDVARFFERLSGTKFSFSAAEYKVLASYLLDGQLWLIHGKIMEPGSKGREYARINSAASSRLLPACDIMSRVQGKRKKEFEQCVRDITSQKFLGKPGNKMFFRGDFMAHNRKSWASSVKMFSERTLNSDTSPHGEGLFSQHQSDGVNYIFRDGSEYYDISPVFDFYRWPGITIDYRPTPHDYETIFKSQDGIYNYWPSRGLTDFVGGVSDGEYGAATMDFKHRLLVAKKAWFFHDEVMVALGAGITGFDWQNTQTTINQEWSQSPIRYNDLSLESGKVDVPEGSWAYANGVGYQLIKGKRFHLQNSLQKGSWRKLAQQQKDEVVEGKVTSLWIEHGKGPETDAYAYAVYPALGLENFKARLKTPEFMILSNTSSLQAVKFKDQWQIIFHEKGELKLDQDHTLSVDKPVAVLLRKLKGRWQLHLSAPDQKVAGVNVLILRRKKPIMRKRLVMPQEHMAGSSQAYYWAQ